MLKNKIDYKLVNIALIAGIIYLLYHTGKLWMGVTDKIIAILLPFFFSFIIAYAFYPAVKYLEKKGFPKSIAIFAVVAIIVSLFAITAILIAPLLFDQLSSLFNSIISFLKEMSVNYDWNVGPLQDSLSKTFKEIIVNLGKYVSDGALSVIGVSLSVISAVVISFSAFIYFLIDMERIREGVRNFLKKTSTRAFRYVQTLDHEMHNYLTRFVKIIFISLIEYTLAFYIIGHPNALLLGFLAAVATLIPYFGGIVVNCIAVITAFVSGPVLFIKTIIAFLVLSSLDGYLINPLVYGKTNEVHPIVVIMSVFAGGILFGVTGIILSLPCAILLIATYKFFREDIVDKYEEIKEGKDEKEKPARKKEKNRKSSSTV